MYFVKNSIVGLIIFSVFFMGSVVFADCPNEVTFIETLSLEGGDGIDGPYIDNGDGTVTDIGTGLMWQQSHFDNRITWEEACQYCQYITLGGYEDWEVPDIYQLSSIIDTNYQPQMNSNFFYNEPWATYYWTISTHPETYSCDNKWTIWFNDGDIDHSYITNDYYVRCVRNEDSEPLNVKILVDNNIFFLPATISFGSNISGGGIAL